MAGISKTVVSVQPGKVEEVIKFIDSQSCLLTQLEGEIGFAVAITGTDEITIIGVYDNTESAEAASGTVQNVFSDLAPLMASRPNRSIYSGEWFAR